MRARPRLRFVSRRALRIFTERGVAIAWPVVCAAVATPFSFTLVGLPVVAWMLGLATFASVGERSLRPEQIKVGLVAALTVLPSVGAVTIGARVAGTSVPDAYPAVGALVFGIAMLGTAALTPLVGTAASLARCGGTISDALGRSLLRCAQLGPARSAMIGAIHGGVLVAPCVIAATAFELLVMRSWVGPDAWYLRVIVLPLLCALFVAAGVAAIAIGAALGEPEPDRAPRHRLRTMSVVPVVALVATAVLVLLVPAPMWTPVGPRTVSLEPDRTSFEIAERDCAIVDVFRGSERVASVRLPAGHYVDWPDSVWPLESGWADGRFVVATWGPDPDFFLGATFDADGRRLDDGPCDRLRARTDVGSVVGVLTALLFAGVAVARGRRATHPGADGPVVIDAIVRDGSTRLESIDGTTVLALDRALPSLCNAPLVDGARVRIVMPRAAALGPRQGASPAPPGAWILDHGVEPANARTLHTARTIAVPALVAVLGALLAGSCALLLL